MYPPPTRRFSSNAHTRYGSEIVAKHDRRRLLMRINDSISLDENIGDTAIRGNSVKMRTVPFGLKVMYVVVFDIYF